MAVVKLYKKFQTRVTRKDIQRKYLKIVRFQLPMNQFSLIKYVNLPKYRRSLRFFLSLEKFHLFLLRNTQYLRYLYNLKTKKQFVKEHFVQFKRKKNRFYYFNYFRFLESKISHAYYSTGFIPSAPFLKQYLSKEYFFVNNYVLRNLNQGTQFGDFFAITLRATSSFYKELFSLGKHYRRFLLKKKIKSLSFALFFFNQNLQFSFYNYYMFNRGDFIGEELAFCSIFLGDILSFCNFDRFFSKRFFASYATYNHYVITSKHLMLINVENKEKARFKPFFFRRKDSRYKDFIIKLYSRYADYILIDIEDDFAYGGNLYRLLVSFKMIAFIFDNNLILTSFYSYYIKLINKNMNLFKFLSCFFFLFSIFFYTFIKRYFRFFFSVKYSRKFFFV